MKPCGWIHASLLILAILLPWDALAYCAKDWACYEIIEQDDSLEFWLVNQKPYPFTATLELQSRNLRNLLNQQNSNLHTAVLAGFERKLAFRLAIIDASRSHWYKESFYWVAGDMFAKHKDSYRYTMPYEKNSHYRIVQGFSGGYSHRGASKYAIDIAMPIGTSVHAARGGIVIDIEEQFNQGGASRRYASLANYVVILHEDGTTGEYYHLKKNGALVEVGDSISEGQLIAYSGNTGFSSLPHLHFAVYRAGSHGDFESIKIKFKN